MEKQIDDNNFTYEQVDDLISDCNKALARKYFDHLCKFKVDLNLNSIDKFLFYMNNEQITRFKNAREGDEVKALDMFINWIKWRIDFKPDSISVDSIVNDLKVGKAFIHGCDKDNRPCLIAKTGKHFPSETTFENSFKLGIFWLERICKLADQTKEKRIVALIDRTNTGFKNIDYGAIKKGGLVSSLQDYYADRLHKIYIIHVDWVFKSVFALVSPFLASKTKEKLVILNSVSDLKKYFNEDQLLIEHGGTSNYTYSLPDS